MSNSPSKFPDIQEIGKMAFKFLSDMKQSINEIMSDYKERHRNDPSESDDEGTIETKPRAKKSKKSISDEENE